MLLLRINGPFLSTIILILLHPITTTAQSNWSNFPYNLRSCLNHYTELSSYPRTNSVTWNYCLCNNYENWIANVAACVKEEAPDDLEIIYERIVAVCAGTGTPTLFSLDDFMAAAEAGTETASLSTTTTTTSISSSTTFLTRTSDTPPKQTQTQTTTPTSAGQGKQWRGWGFDYKRQDRDWTWCAGWGVWVHWCTCDLVDVL